MHHYLRIGVQRSHVASPFKWIEVPINGNQLRKEVPKGFAMLGGFYIHIVPSQ
jgi:hypothetical protein